MKIPISLDRATDYLLHLPTPPQQKLASSSKAPCPLTGLGHGVDGREGHFPSEGDERAARLMTMERTTAVNLSRPGRTAIDRGWGWGKGVGGGGEIGSGGGGSNG